MGTWWPCASSESGDQSAGEGPSQELLGRTCNSKVGAEMARVAIDLRQPIISNFYILHKITCVSTFSSNYIILGGVFMNSLELPALRLGQCQHLWDEVVMWMNHCLELGRGSFTSHSQTDSQTGAKCDTWTIKSQVSSACLFFCSSVLALNGLGFLCPCKLWPSPAKVRPLETVSTASSWSPGWICQCIPTWP